MSKRTKQRSKANRIQILYQTHFSTTIVWCRVNHGVMIRSTYLRCTRRGPWLVERRSDRVWVRWGRIWRIWTDVRSRTVGSLCIWPGNCWRTTNGYGNRTVDCSCCLVTLRASLDWSRATKREDAESPRTTVRRVRRRENTMDERFHVKGRTRCRSRRTDDEEISEPTVISLLAFFFFFKFIFAKNARLRRRLASTRKTHGSALPYSFSAKNSCRTRAAVHTVSRRATVSLGGAHGSQSNARTNKQNAISGPPVVVIRVYHSLVCHGARAPRAPRSFRG